jgi:hypothetical protein
LPPPITATSLPRKKKPSQPAGLGAGGDDQGLGQVGVAGIARGADRPGSEIDAGDDVLDDGGADMLGLGAELVHQPGALDGFGEARVILDIGGDGQLPARLHPGDDQRRQPGPGGVDGRGIAGGAGAEDQQAGTVDIGHGLGSRRFRSGVAYSVCGAAPQAQVLQLRQGARILRCTPNGGNETRAHADRARTIP